MEDKIITYKAQRPFHQRESIIYRQRSLLHSLYRDYLKTLVPSQWFYYPQVAEITELPAFKIINAADDVEVEAESVTSLRQPAATWVEDRKAGLRIQIADTAKAQSSEAGSPAVEEKTVPFLIGSSTAAVPDVLELVTSVFRCGSANCLNNVSPWAGQFNNSLFGWGGAITHQCSWGYGYVPTVVRFSEKSSSTVAELVKLKD